MGATKLQLVTMMVVAIISVGMMSTAMGAEHCPQKNELVAFQASLGNGSFFDSWTTDTAQHCCRLWEGVTCNADYMVTAIEVRTSDTTSGKIPDNLDKFPELERLVIGHHLPNIDGPDSWPNDLKNLANLKLLEIIGTKLSHQVPEVLGQIPNLEVLVLSNNRLHGGAGSLATAPKLEYLDLSYNHISGSLPTTLPPALNYLNLNGNRYGGQIPDSIATNWPSGLKSVALSNNQLQGSPEPFFTGGKQSLRYLYLGRNQLSFNMSTAVLPTGLIGLDLSHNQIYGFISQQVNDLENLSVFLVNNNQLCGPIPTGVLNYVPPSFFENNHCADDAAGPLCGQPLPACKHSYKTTSRDDAPLARPASLHVDPLRYRFLPLQK